MTEDEQISQDDIMDVVEMTKILETHISEVLADNDINLAISALITASINSIISRCENVNQIILSRAVLIECFDQVMRSIGIKKFENPPYP